MTKSIYLSEGRFAGVEEPAGWKSELAQLQRSLKSGQEIHYDRAELERIAATKEVFRRFPQSTAWNAVLRVLLPGVIFVASIWILVWMLKRFHH